MGDEFFNKLLKEDLDNIKRNRKYKISLTDKAVKTCNFNASEEWYNHSNFIHGTMDGPRYMTLASWIEYKMHFVRDGKGYDLIFNLEDLKIIDEETKKSCDLIKFYNFNIKPVDCGMCTDSALLTYDDDHRTTVIMCKECRRVERGDECLIHTDLNKVLHDKGNELYPEFIARWNARQKIVSKKYDRFVKSILKI